jgi:FlaA1/EpsC-like NDP-sugar epimerase
MTGSDKITILVTGATGNIGTELVKRKLNITMNSTKKEGPSL